VTVAVFAVLELLMFFSTGGSGLQRIEASPPPLAALVVGPLEIALAVGVWVRARKNTRRELIENIAFGVALMVHGLYIHPLFCHPPLQIARQPTRLATPNYRVMF
jgi:hypothetical protein